MSSEQPNVPYGYCHCGCRQKTTLIPSAHLRKGQRKGEPRRFITGHNSRRSPVDLIEDPATHCWIWQLSRTTNGYCQIRVDGQPRQAHRVFYEAMVGPIPLGLTIDHLCRNRACVNPGHLEPVTNRENGLRGNTIAARNARKTQCPQGHPYDDANTIVLKNGARRCRICRDRQAREREERRKARAVRVPSKEDQ